MGYNLYRFKDKPTDKDYNIKVFVSPDLQKEFVSFIETQDFLASWHGEEGAHDDMLEMKGMQAYFEKQRLFYKYSPWWTDTSIANKFNKKSSIQMDAMHAFYICDNFQKGVLPTDKDATMKNDGPVYRIEWEDVKGKYFDLIVSKEEIEELIIKRNLYAQKAAEYEEIIPRFQDFIQNLKINNDEDFPSRIKPKEIYGESNDPYDGRAYIDLE